MILGRYLRREDLKVLTTGDKGGPSVGHELLGHHITILDAQQAVKVLWLFPETKEFRRPTRITTSPKDDSTETEKSKPARQVDFYEQVRSLPSDEAKKLPDRTIDGKRAIGYRFVWKFVLKNGQSKTTQDIYGQSTTTRDIWVDPSTKLPVRIENTIQGKQIGQTMVCSDFIWNAPLDQSLFSMMPPEGYTERKPTPGAAPADARQTH